MELRKRTSRSVAGRHDLNYFKNGSPLRRWQGRLTLAALFAAVAWVTGSAFWQGPKMLSKGPLSLSHAAFGAKCSLCHRPAGIDLFHRAGFRKEVPDVACRACHAVPAHYASQRQGPACSACHIEHTGAEKTAHAADGACTLCHANLAAVNADTRFTAVIHSFEKDHPEFAPSRTGFMRNSGFKFAHAAHMKHGLAAPNGPVQMGCADCHRSAAKQNEPWPYGATMQGTAHSEILSRDHGRAYLAPVTYASGCHDCHSLKFDVHISEEAPHADPAQVRVFVAGKIRAFAAEHPEVVAAELRDWNAGSAEHVPRAHLMVVPRNLSEWVTVRTAEAERRVWHRSCGLCHEGKIPEIAADGSVAELTAAIVNPTTLPKFAPTRQPIRQLTHAVFSHDAHRAVACAQCHTRAAASENANDVLLPSITSCRRCHDRSSHLLRTAFAAGHAESGCFECHEYHAWDETGMRPQPVNADILRKLGVTVPR